MRVSRLVLVFGLLVSFVFASPILGNTHDQLKRDDGSTHWLFPRKGGGGGGRASGGHPSKGGGSTPSNPKPNTDPPSRNPYQTSNTPRSSNGFYKGGSAVPYRAGDVSPRGLYPVYISPYPYWEPPIYWGPYGAYYYHVNETTPALPNNTAHNMTDPVLCVCEAYLPCGCDNANSSYTLPSGVEYTLINGTEYAIVNGTLANGTATPGAASSGMSMNSYLIKMTTWGFWVIGGSIVFLAI